MFYLPSWKKEELEPLYAAIEDAMVWAERYGDEVMSFYLKLLANLILARIIANGDDKTEDNNDT
jgi:hypothetical protein